MKKEGKKLPRFVIRAALLSFLLQTASIGILHSYRFRTTDNHFAFGWEMGCIGRAIAEGRGFSDPFCMPSGPSAWEPPVYPYLIAVVFKTWGVYSTGSAWILLTLNCLFSALTCVPIHGIASQTFGEKAARWAVWTWALLPYTWYWSIHWVWDTTMSPMLLSCIFLLTLRLAEREGAWDWALFGGLWGLMALLNPSLLSFLPFCGLWAWHRRRRRGSRSVPGIAAASLVFILCISPWLARNYRTFGKLVFIRDDFGQQLRLGNGPEATGRSTVTEQPNLNPNELERFRTMGELAYAEERKREAVEFIREHPGKFVELSARRFVYYWAGLPKPDDKWLVSALKMALFLGSSGLAVWGAGRALRDQRRGAGLFVLLLLSYPAVYYVVYPHARYRHPIEPELVILAVSVLVKRDPRERLAPGPSPASRS